MPFSVLEENLNGIKLIEPTNFKDNRGMFLEAYKKKDFEKLSIYDCFVQDNYSISKKNVLRGLHFQKEPYEQAKLVRCCKGKIFDVAVDIRRESSTFGNWISYLLSDQNNLILYIPKGFAHGFCTLTNTAEVAYKTTCEYSPAYESGIVWNDKAISINWPIVNNLIISKKDLEYPKFKI